MAVYESKIKVKAQDMTVPLYFSTSIVRHSPISGSIRNSLASIYKHQILASKVQINMETDSVLAKEVGRKSSDLVNISVQLQP